MGRNLVVCLDGTGNRPKDAEGTNVEILYSLLDLSDPERQIAYYDPGVGTFAAPGAWTPPARTVSRLLGLGFGIGLRQNLGEAYTWVINHYQPGDKIFLFGFSRGAFTARALAGMLYWVGALHPGADNLVPYAVAAYAFPAEPAEKHDPDTTTTQAQDDPKAKAQTEAKFRPLNHLSEVYARTVDTKGHRSVPVHYLGVWDTVRAGGILGRDLRWPSSRDLRNVRRGRHALSIDEKRRPYREYRVDPARVADGSIQEAWFAGVHSDVGGTFNKGTKQRLSTISLKWVVQDAVAEGLLVRRRRYANQLSLTAEHAAGTLHEMPGVWAALGYRRRPIADGDQVHASVLARKAADPHYHPQLPATYTEIDPGWAGPPPAPPAAAPGPTPS